MIGDVYLGFSKELERVFPALLQDMHGDLQEGKTYVVSIQEPKLVANSHVYGMCVCKVQEYGEDSAPAQKIPLGLVVQEEADLYKQVQKVLHKSKESTVMEQELQGLWTKVLEDRVKMLEKERENPVFVSPSYIPPKDMNVVKEEFRKKAFESFSKFYLVLMGKLGGAKGKFLVYADDITVSYQGVYRMNIAVKVKPAGVENPAPIRFTLPVDYEYFDKSLLPVLDRVVKDLLVRFTETQRKPFEFDGVWMQMTKYNGIHTTLRWLLSDSPKEVEVMMGRIRTVIHSDAVKPYVQHVRGYKNELVQITIKPLKGAKTTAPLYLGANGIATGEVGTKIYDRQDSDTNLAGALQMLVGLYGESDVWFRILNCYDLRKRVD